MIKKLIITFLIVLAYKLSSNIIRYIKINQYESEFFDFLTEGMPSNKAVEHKHQTIELFKKAGIPDSSTPVTQPTGYGYLASMQASVFSNYPSSIQIIAGPAIRMFSEAKGVYKTRIFECFNPLYWIEKVLFLPREILLYIGMDSEKVSYKICNVLLTFVWWILVAAFFFFKPYLKDFLAHLLSKF